MPKKESSTENNAPNQMRKQEMEACESQAWQQALVLLVPRQIVFEIYVNLLEQKKTSTCLQQVGNHQNWQPKVEKGGVV